MAGKPNRAALRVLLANDVEAHLDALAGLLAEHGHEVVARVLDPAALAAVTDDVRPDVALVGLGADRTHALAMIEQVAAQALCPVVAVVTAADAAFVEEASRLGAFAVIADSTPEHWRGALDIAMRRFADYRDLHGAFTRRTLIERAKGILMERHSIGDEDAFALLRDHSRRGHGTILEIAEAVTRGHALLPTV